MYGTTLYSNPEMFGLQIIGSIDITEGWDFNKLIVWRDGDNNLLWATDSGCSCPLPFEWLN